MMAFIVRQNDAALMERLPDLESAERDMRTRDPHRTCLAIVTAETHRVATVDGYTYAVPKDWRATIPTIEAKDMK